MLHLRSAPSPDIGFFDLGMDSLMAVELRNRVNRVFPDDLALSNTAVFDHPDATRLARHLNERLGEAPVRGPRIGPAAASPRREGQRIAIVGMACRFPGGPDLAAFQELLASGRDAVTRGRPDGLYADAETEADRPWGAYVEGMDLFDAGFFRISPVEAELMDPQQRMLLETSWAALEDAGIDPGRLRGASAGVYVGIANQRVPAPAGRPRPEPLRRHRQPLRHGGGAGGVHVRLRGAGDGHRHRVFRLAGRRAPGDDGSAARRGRSRARRWRQHRPLRRIQPGPAGGGHAVAGRALQDLRRLGGRLRARRGLRDSGC